MKKSIKILGLVLSLALICGALVVAAFAADGAATGITVIKQQDFNSFSAQEYGYGTGFPEGSTATEIVYQSGVYLCYSDKRLGYAALRSSEYETNNYLYWRVDDGGVTATGGGPYFEVTLASNPALSSGVPVVDKMSNYSYYVADFDLFTPGGIIPHGMNAQFLSRYLTAAGGQTFFDTHSAVYFRMKDGVPSAYFQMGDNANVDVPLDATSWNHITFIVEITMKENAPILNWYLYINGEFALVTKGITSSLASEASNFHNGDITNAAICQLRFNYPSKVDIAGVCGEGEYEEAALDNVVARKISTTSDTNLSEVLAGKASLGDWDSNIYDAEKMPFGNYVAQNLTTETKYDSLQKAVDAAKENDVISLVADCGAAAVSNTIEIRTNGYKCDISAEFPYTYDLVDGVYYFEESTEYVTVLWNGCGHVEGCADEAHPGDVESYVALNGNIYDSYPKAHDWSYSDPETGILYVLSGWTVAETGKTLAADAVVDEALLSEGLLELDPVFTTKVYAYEYTNADGNVVKEYDSVALNTIFTNAKNGTTVKLLNDIVVTASSPIGKTLTLDLNGHTITSIQMGSTAKYSLFTVSGNFTLTTSQPGAKIFHAKQKNATEFQGDGIISASGNKSVVTIDGTKGLQTWSAVLYQGWGYCPGELYINGGEYYSPAVTGDHNGGLINADAVTHVELNNATFWNDQCAIAILGGCFTEANLPSEPAKVLIDNCVFLGGNLANFDNYYVDATITNSYIAGSIPLNQIGPTRTNCFAPKTGGTWTLGEGTYVLGGATLSDDVVIANGMVAHSVSSVKTFTTTLNKFVVGDVDASKALTVADESYSFGTYVSAPAEPVKITWYDTDGVTVLGVTEDTLPGMTATAPVTPVTELNGWVNATYTQWINPDGVESSVIPVGVTEYSLKLVEGSDAVYTVGKVPMYMSYDLLLHFQINVYVPKDLPEGITNVVYKYDGGVRSLVDLSNTANGDNTAIINGERYLMGQNWPKSADADDDVVATVSFDYNGQTFTYSTPGFNIGDYARAVFAGDYSMEIKQATLSALEHVEAVNKATGATVSEEVVNAIAAAATAGVSIEIPDLEAGEAIDESAVKDYIDSIQVAYNSSNGGVQFRFYKTQKAIDEAATVAVIWNGHKSATSATDATSGSWPQTDNEYGKAFWYTHNTRAYDIDGTFTIQVKVGGAVVASLEYSLEAYAAAIKEACTAEQWDLLMTTLAYAKYAEVVKK